MSKYLVNAFNGDGTNTSEENNQVTSVTRGRNSELLTKTTIAWDGSKTTNSILVPLGNLAPVLITITNSVDEDQDITVTLLHQTETSVYIPYIDATGTQISWTVTSAGGSGVFGVIQGFPRFLGGSIVLTASTHPANGSTTTIQVQEI